ncbi:hypothetical protein G6F22_018233 [Rhizopus arrhizus]|nr:hypothetical protein G6F22_018233 [Rhizopus arrhizus]
MPGFQRLTTPWCASDISPGQGGLPPPTSAAALALWCGARNGRCRQRRGSSPSPLTEAIAASCSASVSSVSGNRLGRREANSVLPQPGLPISNRWCPPAAATSNARRACACPRTSARSGSGNGVVSTRSTGGNRRGLPNPAQHSSSVRATRTSACSANAASAALPGGTTRMRPASAAAIAAGSAPATGRSSPVRPSSPRNSY